MKLFEVINAAPGLQKLILQDLPLKTAYEVMKLTERVNPLLNFFGNEEIKARGDEKIMAELRDLEVDGFEDFFRIPISLDADIRLSPSDVRNLSIFCDFKEAEK